jgi:hypothetical protein
MRESGKIRTVGRDRGGGRGRSTRSSSKRAIQTCDMRWEEEGAFVSKCPCYAPLRSPPHSPHGVRVEVVCVQRRSMVVESNADEPRRIADKPRPSRHNQSHRRSRRYKQCGTRHHSLPRSPFTPRGLRHLFGPPYRGVLNAHEIHPCINHRLFSSSSHTRTMATAMDVDPPTHVEATKAVATTGDKKPRFEVKKVGRSSGSRRVETGRDAGPR